MAAISSGCESRIVSFWPSLNPATREAFTCRVSEPSVLKVTTTELVASLRRGKLDNRGIKLNPGSEDWLELRENHRK